MMQGWQGWVTGTATSTFTPSTSPSGDVSYTVYDALAQQLNEQRETENYKNFILLALMVLLIFILVK